MRGNRVETTITQVSGRITDENRDAMEDAASLEFREWLTLGDKASLALAHGLVSSDEAQTLYRIHGESHDHYKRQPLERRLAYVLWITPLVSAIIGSRMEEVSS